MENLKLFIKKIQDAGIPLIWVIDPIKKTPSVSLTLMLISFGMVVTALIGKMNGNLEIDIAQSKELFALTALLYFGRTLTKTGDKLITDSKEESTKKDAE